MAEAEAVHSAQLREKLENVFAQFTSLHKHFSALTTKSDEALAEAKHERAINMYNTLPSLESEIVRFNSTVADKANKISYNSSFVSIDDMIDIIKAKFLKLQNLRIADGATPPRPPAETTIKIKAPFQPKIAIPKFSGNYKEWIPFISLFESIVAQETEITDVEKLQYLRSYLTGDALKLVQSYNLTNENYEPAFKALKDRYSNPRIMANAHLNALLSFKPITHSTHANLQEYYSIHMDNINSYRKLNMADAYDYLLFQICYIHLDKKTQTAFDHKYHVNQFPTYENLRAFVQNQLQALELHIEDEEGKAAKTTGSSQYSTQKSASKRIHVGVKEINEKKSRNPTCVVCSASHLLYLCPKFQAMSVPERYDALKSKLVCFNCFGAHARSVCQSAKRCRTCGQQHHTLLHYQKAASHAVVVDNEDPTPDTTAISNIAISHHVQNNLNSDVLLGTAIGAVVNDRGISTPVRILIDPGSQVTCITKECAERCGLKISPGSIKICGIAATTASNAGEAECLLTLNRPSKIKLAAKAIVMPKITMDLPTFQIPEFVIQRFSSLPFCLADPQFYKKQPIDFLLGADLYPHILVDRPRVRGAPSGIHTIFGLMILGGTPTRSDNIQKYANNITVDSINDTLHKFWETEEVCDVPPPDPADEICEKLFRETTTRDASGRYVVALPFLSNPADLGKNRNVALRRLHGMERRFLGNPKLHSEYKAFMDEYKDLQHMEIVHQPADYVIPHHAVFKESTSTKLRVVFDASNGDTSLNQLLCKGPKLQRDITLVISGFRTYKIALCSDLQKMYRQIIVRPEDRKYQHIFWREDPNQEVQEFELKTVTYGLAPSAFLAQRTLQQLVVDEGAAFPLAAQALKNQTYVDDIVGGADSIEEAKQLYSELIALLGRGGFFPRKWSSSSKLVLENIPAEHRETPLVVHTENEVAFKVLGLQWNAAEDSFVYTIQPFTAKPTKREVLSYIAKMFDPMGWLTPFTFNCKQLMQEIWRNGTDWDEPLPEHLRKTWINLTTKLDALAAIRIPRPLHAPGYTEMQIIGFCDASQNGYAAALYLRSQSTREVKVSLLAAKSRVAPIKPMSIPRLELNAAVLLTCLHKAQKPFLERLPAHAAYFFSDSEIVLNWIHTAPHKLKTYVANRIVELIDNSRPEQWHHVSSEFNACDCASRGLTPAELQKETIWWQGPAFLHQRPLNIKAFKKYALPKYTPELKTVHALTKNISSMTDTWITKVVTQVPNFNKLIRVIAFMMRFKQNSLAKFKNEPCEKGPLKVRELQYALMQCVLLVQQQFYSHEIRRIKQQKTVPSLRALTPFLDAKGFLRVGGRLINAPIPYASKHPLLIPKRSHLAVLICEEYHKTTLHGGPQIMRAAIQQKFWIPGIGNLLRKIVFNCKRCYRYKAKPLQPIMADLPACRFAQVRAFTNVGVDYAGPFSVKETKRRKAFVFKGYVCLFVCLATKAIHLEFVTELTTTAFLAVLDRFVARRGLCTNLYSDNGTNFVGAKRELTEIKEFLSKSNYDVENYLAQRQIQWHFNPPAAPHFGGIWEANIKIMKKHLILSTANHVFTQEEFSTLLCRIEAVLNSRPLCPLSAEPNDDRCYLTPGHFLIGDTPLSVPEESLENVRLNTLSRWQLVQQNLQTFWKQWKMAYLQHLIPRKKWTDNSASLNVNDIVIVQKENTPPLIWPLGRILSLITDKHGVSRSATIKTATGILTRPVNSLLPFPPPNVP